MDRVVLDGVVNAHNYYHRFGIDVDQLLSADAAFRAVLAQCIEAGPARCALASLDNAATVADLEATLWRAVDRYRKGPVAAGTIDVVDAHLFRELLFITIKYPTNVAVAAQHIRNLVAGTNLTEAAAYHRALSEGIAMPDDSLYGISCSDKFPRTDSLAGILPDLERMLETSELFGSQIGSIAAVCPSWPWAAKERYDGGFAPGSIKTKTPILLFGNTYDPVTPLPSARNMSAAFEGSVVVEQHGFGVSSFFFFSFSIFSLIFSPTTFRSCSKKRKKKPFHEPIKEQTELTPMVACYHLSGFGLHCPGAAGVLC